VGRSDRWHDASRRGPRPSEPPAARGRQAGAAAERPGFREPVQEQEPLRQDAAFQRPRRFFGGTFLGFDGFDELRDDHHGRLRHGNLGLFHRHLALRTRRRLDDGPRRAHRFLLRGHLRLVLTHDDAACAHRQFLAGDERLNDLRLQRLIRVADLGTERLQLEDDVLLGLPHLLCDVAHFELCCRH